MRPVCLLIVVLLLALTERILMLDCAKGYKAKMNKECVDEDECEDDDPPICGKHADCKNTEGSYSCQCQAGFKPPGIFKQEDSVKCTDIDECVENSTVCGPNAQCVNSDGSYSCTCNVGYISSNKKETFLAGLGVQCIDRNECEDFSLCGRNATCNNTAGSHNCTCAPGFRLKSGQTNFTDVDSDGSCESVCDIDKSICGGGVCKNGKDGHECVCKPGFTNNRDKKMKCTDIDECVENSTVCGPNAQCVNSEGSYSCTCNTGYISSSKAVKFLAGRGVQCIELNCDAFIRDSSQAPPELTHIYSLMTNSCLELSKSETVGKENLKPLDVESLLEAFLASLDKLLHDGFQADAHKVSLMFGIVESVLKLIGSLLPNNQTIRSTAETEVELLVKRGSSPPEGLFTISTNNIHFTSDWKTATGNTYLGFTTAALLSYKNLEKSLNSYYGHLKTQDNINFKINSKVVTAIVSNTETNHLEKPVSLTFSHLQHMNEKHICVFWDPALEGGAWSTHGCTKVQSSDVQTICSCDHLSSFAVLMALYDIGDVYELSVITWVGLSVSLICLLICIATFHLVRSIQCTRNTIHLHLCIALFIAFFIFLVGITRTQSKVGCAVIAGLLHYFFLAAFCWMCLEGVQLFRMVVLVFNTTLRPVYMYAAGYGVPAVIVAVSAIIKPDGYGSEQHCWLNLKDGFIWSFYGPVCIIIIVNVFFFLITIWKLAEKFSSLNPDLNNLRKIRTFTITAIAQLCILGIMWVFGCFQFDDSSLALSYIYTVLGSLQGVLMFILHCWLSKQVRDEYVKLLACICTPQKRKYSEFSSNQTSKSQASKSVQNTGESNI